MSHHHYRRRLHPISARRLRRLHLTLALLWGPVMIPLTVIPGAPLHGVANSVMWVIAISYYANMAAHLSAYAGESATVAAEAAADHKEILNESQDAG